MGWIIVNDVMSSLSQLDSASDPPLAKQHLGGRSLRACLTAEERSQWGFWLHEPGMALAPKEGWRRESPGSLVLRRLGARGRRGLRRSN